MLYTKLPTSAIDFDDSVNGGVYGKYRSVSAYFWQCTVIMVATREAMRSVIISHYSLAQKPISLAAGAWEWPIIDRPCDYDYDCTQNTFLHS